MQSPLTEARLYWNGEHDGWRYRVYFGKDSMKTGQLDWTSADEADSCQLADAVVHLCGENGVEICRDEVAVCGANFAFWRGT